MEPEGQAGSTEDDDVSRRRRFALRVRFRRSLGVMLLLLSGVCIAVAWWLNQPGFVGDPRVKLLEDGPALVVVLVLLAVAAVGAWLVLTLPAE